MDLYTILHVELHAYWYCLGHTRLVIIVEAARNDLKYKGDENHEPDEVLGKLTWLDARTVTEFMTSDFQKRPVWAQT